MLDIGTLRGKIEIEGADEAVKGMKDTAKEADTLKSKLGAGLAKAGGATLKGLGALAKASAVAVGAAASAAAAGMAAMAKASVEAYSSTEQLKGGMKTLFGDASDTVIDNANKAFATTGLSANQYMENVSNFSASLISSVGGDTEKAAQVADMAIQDMSDNASIFGTDIESIQNAYQGFAKQNYTMLDNLKLGYGGTKTEMERLLADAGKLTGQKYDINNLNDVYQAIHAIQEEQGIAGNAANEASKTIQGSLGATKAAWENLMAGMADPDADFDSLFDGLIDSAMNVVNNMAPVLERIVNSLSVLAPKISQKITELLPVLLPIITNLITGIATQLPTLINTLMTALTTIFPTIIQAIVALLPTLVTSLVTTLVELAPMLIDGFFQLLSGLAQAIPAVVPILVAALPELIMSLVEGVISNLPIMLQAGVDLLKGLLDGIVQAWPEIQAWFGDLGNKALNALGDIGNCLLEAGKSIIDGLWKGMKSIWDNVTGWVSGLGKWISDHKGPEEYDKQLLVKNGQWIMQGLQHGLESSIPSLRKTLTGISGVISGTNFNASAQLAYATASGSGAYGFGQAAPKSQTVNVYINGTRINDDPAIEAKFTELMYMLARKGNM